MDIQAERGLLGLMTVGSETCQQGDKEVVWTAVARVLDLTDILELINDGLE